MTSTDIQAVSRLLRSLEKNSLLSDAFPKIDESNNKQATFVKALLSKTYTNDVEIAVDIYGSEKLDQRYRTMKYRVLEKSIETIVGHKYSNRVLSAYALVHHRLKQQAFHASLLLRDANRSAARSIASKCIATARKYDFTELEIEFASVLLTCAARDIQAANFRDLAARLKLLKERLSFEIQTEIFLDHIYLLGQIESNLEKRISLCEDYSEQATEYLKTYQSHTLVLNNFRLTHLLNVIRHAPFEILSLCNEYEAYLNRYPYFMQPSRVGEIHVFRMSALLDLRMYEDVVAACQDAMSAFREGGYNWFLSLDTLFIGYLANKNYDLAIDAHRLAVSHPDFSLQSAFIQQRWTLFQALVVLVDRLGIYGDSAFPASLDFRLARFLNSVQELEYDKQESNFLIQIVHIVFLIMDSQFDKATDRIYALRVYLSRYLRENYYLRDRFIVRIFSNLAACSFNPKVFRARHSDLIQRMYEPLDPTQPISTNELIHYGLLIDRLLDVLERRSS